MLVVLSAGVFIVFVGWFALYQYLVNGFPYEGVQSAPITQASPSKFLEYQNEKAGFRFRYPVETYGYGFLESSFNFTQIFNDSPAPAVPLTVWEDSANNAVYLITQYVYHGTDQVVMDYFGGNPAVFTKYYKAGLDTGLLKEGFYKDAAADMSGIGFWRVSPPPIAYLKFVYGTVHSDKELNAWITKNFESGCSIISREAAQQPGVTSLVLGYSSGASCNYSRSTATVYYSPRQNRVIGLIPEQSATTRKDIFFDSQMRSLDDTIAQSFEILQ